MSSKAIATSVDGQQLLNQKAELAIKAGDMLIFSGPGMASLNAMAAAFGMPGVSIGMIFPTKNEDSMRPFLGSLLLIISTALDDQVELAEFTAKLAEAIQEIKAIAEEEK